jgi:CheY-like chemotaxis protein
MRQLPSILLVEDEPASIDLTIQALTDSGIVATVHAVGNGAAAIEFLRGGGHPDIILTDFNLPGLHGRELLSFIKADPRLKTIPTIVISTSNSRDTVQECAVLCADAYIVKSAHWDQFRRDIESIVGRFLPSLS